jgi:carbamoyl-phosphate synthase small subunit
MEGILALEDGRVFRGRSFGATGETSGEVVFNTSMTGYQEVLTDPSYRGQIVTMTCPEIGNYGTNPDDVESATPQVRGFVVRSVSVLPSSWRARQGLPQYLREHDVVGIAEIDTRALTRHIRTRGAMKGILSTLDRDEVSLVAKARQAPGLLDQDLVGAVSCRESYRWEQSRDPRWRSRVVMDPPARRMHCVAYDFGIKRNIMRLLRETGFEVTVVPAATPADEALALRPDALFLSNGPGDPMAVDYAIRAVRGLLGRLPTFGICLGHQVAALALGARTFKLKYGHRGANHPVKDLRSGVVSITSQNHGYAVDPESLPQQARLTHVNLNDGTCEGFVEPEAGLLTIQYHPESSPGPHDSFSLFREFRALAEARATRREPAQEEQR